MIVFALSFFHIFLSREFSQKNPPNAHAPGGKIIIQGKPVNRYNLHHLACR